MKELHTNNINGGHEASYGLGHVPGRGAYSNNERIKMAQFYKNLSEGIKNAMAI